MHRILLITNADAGNDEEAAVEDALKVLRGGADVDVQATSDADQLDQVLRKRDGRDVVAAGGDGTLHALVAALRASDDLGGPTIGLIPLGTGNDFARGVKIPLDPARAADVVVRGHPTQVDVLLDDEGGIVVNAVHCGIGADAGLEAEPYKARLGKAGYVVGAVIAGFKSPGHRMSVTADGVVLADGRRPVLQVGVSNGVFVGGGTPLAPDADPTDGLADVMVSFSVRRTTRLLYAVRLKRGTHEERHDVRTTRATHVEVSGHEFHCNADGELTGPIPRRSWDVLPGAFTMMLPTSAQAETADEA